MWYVLWAAILILSPSISDAAVTYAGTASSARNCGATSLTYSHTVPAGSDKYLVVGVSTWGATTPTVTATFNAVSMTQLGTRTAGPAGGRLTLFGLINPTSTTANVVVTASASGTEMSSGAMNFVGVDQATPTGTFVSATAGSSSASVNASSASGERVVDTIYFAQSGVGTPSATGSGQTARVNGAADDCADNAMSEAPGAASVTMSWSFAQSEEWGIGAIPLKASAGGATVIPVINSPLYY